MPRERSFHSEPPKDLVLGNPEIYLSGRLGRRFPGKSLNAIESPSDPFLRRLRIIEHHSHALGDGAWVKRINLKSDILSNFLQ